MRNSAFTRSRQFWLAALALAVALAGVWAALVWRGDTRPEAQASPIQPWPPAALPPSAANPTRAEDKASASAEVATAALADPVGGALDLKQVYDHYIASTDVGQRRFAVRAFDACLPAFLSAPGQTPSPEPLIAALPSEHRAQREAAYRSLFARCHRFLSEDRAALDAQRQALRRDPQNEDAAQGAHQAVLAGDLGQVESLLNEALRGTDPAAIEALAGIAARIVQARQSDDADPARLRHAHAVDAALPWVACDLGLDCSAQSLWALQLCAVEGQCEGDFGARLSARRAHAALDADAVQQQRVRLLALLRSGRALGTADLLP